MLHRPADSRIERRTGDEHLNEPLSSLSVELMRISAEIQSINSGFQAQLQQAIADTQETIETHYRTQYENSISELREQLQIEIRAEMQKEFYAEMERRIAQFAEVRKEIVRVTAQLEATTAEIQALLDDPASELSKVIRKRAEQVEMQSYLHGLRFALGETP